MWADVCVRLNCLCARVRTQSSIGREGGREGGREREKQTHTGGQRDHIAQKDKDEDKDEDRGKEDTGGKEAAG